MDKYYFEGKMQRVYKWVGFVVVWSFVAFIIWSMIEQDKAINMLVNIFS